MFDLYEQLLKFRINRDFALLRETSFSWRLHQIVVKSIDQLSSLQRRVIKFIQ